MISIIVAIGKNGLIGKGNDLPWHYPEDLKYFKKTTLGKPVFMGYNTYLSIYNRLGKALPNRSNYVLTYEDTLPGEGIVIKDLVEFVNNHEEEVFCIGGKMIYGMVLPYADRLYITRVNKDYEGDVFFPEYDESLFELVSSVESGDLVFEVYERKRA
ncbi:MAG: dihydrofolate reductase [Bacilli bacterium]|nr:dihydrofolate reductase [Bacilli bacterium]